MTAGNIVKSWDNSETDRITYPFHGGDGHAPQQEHEPMSIYEKAAAEIVRLFSPQLGSSAIPALARILGRYFQPAMAYENERLARINFRPREKV